MALPVNVAVCTVTGAFVTADGTAASGTVTFTATPNRLLDADATPPTTIIGTPITAILDVAGEFTVDLPATDDDDLNPTDFTYHVAVRLGDYAAYSFCMEAPTGTVDLAAVTPIIASSGDAITSGPPGPPGDDGPPGEGVPVGGDTGEVLAKLTGDDYNTTWIAASAPGLHASTHGAASTDPVTITKAQVTGLTADISTLNTHIADSTAVHGIADTADLETTSGAQARVDSHVNDTSSAHAATAIAYSGSTTLSATTVETALDELDTEKVATARTIATTAPLAGGGTLAADRTLTVSTFGTSAAGVVPASGGGTANFLRADGTWVEPPGAFAGVGNTATFSYNTTTSEPPTGNQLRLNSTTFTAATRLWVMQTTVDGLDVSIGLARILAGHQIYFQDRDNASNWVKYNVTADGVDDGTYWDFAVAYNAGPGGIPAGQVELQAVAPGTVGVPPGGAASLVLGKETAADYDVEWVQGRWLSLSQAAYDAIPTKDSNILYIIV